MMTYSKVVWQEDWKERHVLETETIELADG